MQIRAAVLEEFGEPLVVQDVELDDPKGHEVLVRLVACGVCTVEATDAQRFVPHELALDDVNRGYELMESQDGSRSVIRFA